jgi:hypothetical protein
MTIDQTGCSHRQGRISVASLQLTPTNSLSFLLTFASRLETSALVCQNFIGLLITPNVPEQGLKSDTDLVIDCSDSIEGQPIAQARSTLQFFLTSLSKHCNFSVIPFDTHFEVIFPNSVEYNTDSFKEASEKLGLMEANLGETDLLLSAAYPRFAPTSRCGCKKQLDLFCQKLNIIRKKEKLNFKIVGIG